MIERKNLTEKLAHVGIPFFWKQLGIVNRATGFYASLIITILL
jgi:hypothetical protein